ncbi:hypothetical protein [Serinicoccus chungangensis]|nr:hypothetical protein [Serinicoccus chungangensis]
MSSLDFARGWIFTTGPRERPVKVPQDWQTCAVCELTGWVHPSTRITHAMEDDAAVVFIGRVVDLEADSGDAGVIAQELLGTLRSDGLEATIRRVSYLGGRYVALIRWNGEWACVPDAGAMMKAFWGSRDGAHIIASHQPLVADAVSASQSPQALELRRRLSAQRRTGTVFWPGALSPYQGIRPLLANHALRWTSGESPRHERFYPWMDLPQMTPAESREKFTQLFRDHVRLLMASQPVVAVSLTGGDDSQATLAAALEYWRPGDITWTYYDFRNPTALGQKDLLRANGLAVRLGLVHKVVPLAAPSSNDFQRSYDRSFTSTRQNPVLAHAVHEHLSSNILELHSLVAEVGTGFYSNNTGAQLSPEGLRDLFQGANDFTGVPGLRQVMEDFIDYSNFSEESLRDRDFKDMFYWEGRLGTWGSLRVQELTMSHDVALPFNQRDIIEALQTSPQEERDARSPLRALAADRLS